MRVNAVGLAYDFGKCIGNGRKKPQYQHTTAKASKGKVVASAVFLAKIGKNKAEIKEFITTSFGYDLDFKIGGYS